MQHLDILSRLGKLRLEARLGVRQRGDLRLEIGDLDRLALELRVPGPQLDAFGLQAFRQGAHAVRLGLRRRGLRRLVREGPRGLFGVDPPRVLQLRPGLLERPDTAVAFLEIALEFVDPLAERLVAHLEVVTLVLGAGEGVRPLRGLRGAPLKLRRGLLVGLRHRGQRALPRLQRLRETGLLVPERDAGRLRLLPALRQRLDLLVLPRQLGLGAAACPRQDDRRYPREPTHPRHAVIPRVLHGRFSNRRHRIRRLFPSHTRGLSSVKVYLPAGAGQHGRGAAFP